METDKQKDNSPKPWLWKKGQSGNPAGRPKGKTMKEYVKEYLERMTDDERNSFLDGMPKEIIWKMGEGNPETKTDITSKGEKISTNSEIDLLIAKKVSEELKSEANEISN